MIESVWMTTAVTHEGGGTNQAADRACSMVLTVSLWQLVALARPFGGPNLHAVVMKICTVR